MALMQRIGQFLCRWMPNFGSFTNWRSLDRDQLFEKGEEIAVGLGLAAVACCGSEFLLWWVGPRPRAV
jgi:hypothetical protein